MCSRILYVSFSGETLKGQMEGGYSRERGIKNCPDCGQESRYEVRRVRIDRFPDVMELRMDHNREMIDWRSMSIPCDLVWTGIEYKFVGMILQDTTIGSEHFIGCVKINDKVYIQEMKGDLRLLDMTLDGEQSFSLSTVIPAGTKNFPVRFYYSKNDERVGPGDWVDVKVDRQPVARTNISPILVRGSSVDSEGELSIPDQFEEFPIQSSSDTATGNNPTNMSMEQQVPSSTEDPTTPGEPSDDHPQLQHVGLARVRLATPAPVNLSPEIMNTDDSYNG